jgi:hypothetical protein
MRGIPGLGLEAFGQPGIVCAERFELHAVDCQHADVRCGPYPRRAGTVGGEKGALADEHPRAELTPSLGRLDDHPAVDDHVEAHARMTPFDQHLAGRDHRLRSHGLEPLKVAGVHVREYRRHMRAGPGDQDERDGRLERATPEP